MTKIYVVEGRTGEYSDRTEWAVCAYENEADAKAHVIAAEQWVQTFLAGACDSYTARERAIKAGNPFDPWMQIDYMGVSWSYYAVELRSAFDAVATPPVQG